MKLLLPGSTVESPNTNTAVTADGLIVFLIVTSASISLVVEISREMIKKGEFSNFNIDNIFELSIDSCVLCGLVFFVVYSTVSETRSMSRYN